MSAVRVLVVEDEFVIGRNIVAALEKSGYHVTAHALDYDEALVELKKEVPDIALLDITLDGDRDGIELADYINQHHQIPFIFLTSHSDPDTVGRATATHPSAYLVKPFEARDIYTSIQVALANFAKAHPVEDAPESNDTEEILMQDALFIKREHLFVKVKFSEIRWLKSDHVYIEVQTADKKHIVRSSFGDLLVKIDSGKFFRVHRSYVVNLEHVDAINHQMLVVDGTEIPIGRSYRDQLLSRLKTAL